MPKAYLNRVLVDNQFKYIQGGVVQVLSGSSKQVLAVSPQTMSRNGYLYVYVSNESPQDVFFDDITVKHYTGPLVQEQSYYPFGLQMAAISDKAIKKNNTPYKYNEGSELEEELNYYNTFFRKYDAQIGRFTGIDILGEETAGLSPYHYGGNNPVVFNDPSGAVSQIGLTNARHNAWSGDTYLFGGIDMDLSTSYIDYMDGESGGGAGGGAGGGRVNDGGIHLSTPDAQNFVRSYQEAYNNPNVPSWNFTVGTNSNGDVGFWQTSVTIEANSGITGNALVSGHFVNTSQTNHSMIAILNDPGGVNYMGHSALLVGSDDVGWKVISKTGRQDGFTIKNNPITGGPSTQKVDLDFKKLIDVFKNKDIMRFKRMAFFLIDASSINPAISKMQSEADSYYSALNNNCGHAISNTFEAIGLNGVGSNAATFPAVYSTPNYMYLYMMNQNQSSFITEIIR